MNRIWTYSLVLLPIVLGIAQVFMGPGTDLAEVRIESVQESAAGGPEQLVFILQYLGTDYELAIEDGEVISQFEFQEMLDFSQAAVARYRILRPDDPANILPGLRELQNLVKARADKNTVRMWAGKLVQSLSSEFSVTAFPARPPNISAGELIYETNCQRCHGATGAGDGPAVAKEEMDPAPRSFRDQRLNSIAPYQAYNAVSFGVEGTAMPAHETLDTQERWDVSFFIFTLREDFSPRELIQGTRIDLRQLATKSNLELAPMVSDGDETTALGYVDYLRRYPPGPSLREFLVLARDTLKRSVVVYRDGDAGGAADLLLDAYLYGIEPAEASLRLVDSGIVDRLESDLASYRIALKNGESVENTLLAAEQLKNTLDEAERSSRETWSGSVFTFVQGLTIILREGIEAALLVGLLLAYLVKAGRAELRPFVYLGCAGGVVAGLLTWLAGRHILLSAGYREALEGTTSLLAAGVLFWVSLWIFHNLDVQRWKAYMRDKVSLSVKSEGAWVLAFAAFLAVYREALETALFYQALWLRSSGSLPLILAGVLAGIMFLSGFVVMWLKLGIRLNLKPFFVLSGILLGLLSVIFAGYGIRELQNVGYVSETPLSWMIALPVFEIWPVRESLGLQLGIVLSFLLGQQLARRSTVSSA